MENGLLVSVPRRFIYDLSGSPYSTRECEDSGDAAIKLQKLYRGYRTRRHLADCAVIARRYGWWDVLEGVLLRHNSEDYAFDKQQSAAKRWARLQKKAAKLGRGLLKDETARKLAFQHWLEAIDARHRYGRNLHLYYDVWTNSSTQEPFFYWLDVGGGRDVDLKKCPRSQLIKEQIAYFGPKERKQYEVVFEKGKLVFKQTGELVDTGDSVDDKWIFVLSTAKRLYVGQKARGRLQHSSFLAGGAATAAGRLCVKQGVLELLEPHSGHYRPTEENFKNFIQMLKENGIDLSLAKIQAISDEMARAQSKSRKHKSSEDELVCQGSMKVDEDFPENTVASSTSNGVNGSSSSNGVEESNHNGSLENSLTPRALQKHSWTSGTGARVSSLSIIPYDVRGKALDVLKTPKGGHCTVRW